MCALCTVSYPSPFPIISHQGVVTLMCLLNTGEQLNRGQELNESKLENQRLCQEIATLKQEILLFGMSMNIQCCFAVALSLYLFSYCLNSTLICQIPAFLPKSFHFQHYLLHVNDAITVDALVGCSNIMHGYNVGPSIKSIAAVSKTDPFCSLHTALVHSAVYVSTWL